MDEMFWWAGAVLFVCGGMTFLAGIIGGVAYLIGKQVQRLYDEAIALAGNRKAARDIALWARAGKPPVTTAFQAGIRYKEPGENTGAYGCPASVKKDTPDA